MEMVILLTVLQSSGHLPFPNLTMCPTRHRKQAHYSIIDLLIATPSYIKTWDTDTSIWKLLFLTSKFSSNWGSRLFSWTLRRRIGRRLSCPVFQESDFLRSHVRKGLLTLIKQGQLPFSAPSSVLAFCLNYSINHSKCPSRAEMEAWRWHCYICFLTWQVPTLSSKATLMMFSCSCLREDVGWRHSGKTVSFSRQMGKVSLGDHCKHSIVINKNTEGAGAVTYFLPVLGKFLNSSELSFLSL